MSTEVAPSFAADYAVENDADVDAAVNYFQAHVEEVKLDDGTVAYVQKSEIPPNAAEAVGAFPFKLRVGPVEFNLLFITPTHTVSEIATLYLPLLRPIQIGRSEGDYIQGVTTPLKKVPLVNGESIVKAVNGEVTLLWDFVALGRRYKGSHPIFHV